MKLPRPLLHAARIADEILFLPALVLVIWGELTPREPTFFLFSWIGEIQDKALHFMAYFGLSAMAAAGLKQRRMVMIACVGLMLLGGALELIQGYTGRDMSFLDEVANIVGVLAGGFSVRMIVERLRRRAGYY